jgi:hypothetical protein
LGLAVLNHNSLFHEGAIMLRQFLIGTCVLAAGFSQFVKANAKDDLQAAAQKLSDSDSYSWTSTTEGNFGSTIEGKTQKDGYTTLAMTLRDNTVNVVKKGDNAVVKTDDGWKTVAELQQDAGDGMPSPEVMAGRMAQSSKPPGAMAVEMAPNLQNLQKTDDGYTADLSVDDIKKQLMRRRPGGQAPEISDPKGTITISVKDGVISKAVLHITATVSFNGNDRPVDRTTTVEIKDVGSTTVDVPADAKAKLDAPAATQPAATPAQ